MKEIIVKINKTKSWFFEKKTIVNNYIAIKQKPGRNGQILRKIQSSKTEPVRNRNYEQPNYKH